MVGLMDFSEFDATFLRGLGIEPYTTATKGENMNSVIQTESTNEVLFNVINDMLEGGLEPQEIVEQVERIVAPDNQD